MVELHHYHLIISLKSYIILILENRTFKMSKGVIIMLFQIIQI
jgi:hypothetical protein